MGLRKNYQKCETFTQIKLVEIWSFESFDKPKSEIQAKKKYRQELRVDSDYYGFREDKDEALEKIEKEAENSARDESIEKWHKEQAEKPLLANQQLEPEQPIPTREEMNEILVNRRKRELMSKYLSQNFLEDLSKQKEEVEVVLGKQKNMH